MDIDLNGGGIQFTKDDLCKDMADQIDDLAGPLNDTLGMADALGKGVADVIPDPSTMIPPLDLGGSGGPLEQLDELAGGIDAMKEKIGEADIAGSGVDFNTLAECLTGFDLQKFAFPPLPDGSLDLSFVGKMLDAAADFVKDTITDAVDALLDPVEALVADAADALKSLLDIDALDKLLEFSQCLQDCPGVDIDSPVDIESKLNKVGLKIDGSIDWDSPVFEDVEMPDGLKDKIDQVGDFKDGMVDKVGGLKDYSPVPKPPTDIPKIPKINNPLNDLDISKKIAGLF